MVEIIHLALRYLYLILRLIYEINISQFTSSWIYIITALIIGSTALFAPYISSKLRKRKERPIIIVHFSHSRPFSQKTDFRDFKNWDPNIKMPVYYFRFMIRNEGETTAKQCEAVIEKLWFYNSNGELEQFENYNPVNLKWSGTAKEAFQNINPGRSHYCDIGHISKKEYQQRVEKKFFIDFDDINNDSLRFKLEGLQTYSAQPNNLPPGRYIIQIGIFSESSVSVRIYFEIDWSGNWRDQESDMFQEIIIKQNNPHTNYPTVNYFH